MAVTGSALLLGSFASTAFADDNHHEMNTSHGSSSSQWNNDNNHSDRFLKYRTTLFTFASGSKEAPGPGDPNGFGTIKVKAYPKDGKLCVSGRIWNIQPATAAHIHEAPKGQSGPVVINLPTPNDKGKINGCVDATEEQLTDLVKDPSNYYFNTHNTEYPNGAVRGQF